MATSTAGVGQQGQGRWPLCATSAEVPATLRGSWWPLHAASAGVSAAPRVCHRDRAWWPLCMARKWGIGAAHQDSGPSCSVLAMLGGTLGLRVIPWCGARGRGDGGAGSRFLCNFARCVTSKYISLQSHSSQVFSKNDCTSHKLVKEVTTKFQRLSFLQLMFCEHSALNQQISDKKDHYKNLCSWKFYNYTYK